MRRPLTSCRSSRSGRRSRCRGRDGDAGRVRGDAGRQGQRPDVRPLRRRLRPDDPGLQQPGSGGVRRADAEQRAVLRDRPSDRTWSWPAGTTTAPAGWAGVLDRRRPDVDELARPRYPNDTSAGGMASPEYLRTNAASDPLGAFDLHGNFYFGAISYNDFAGPKTNGDVWVARYETVDRPGTAGTRSSTSARPRCSPARRQRTSWVSSTTSRCSRSTGRADLRRNVYMCWSRFTGNGQNKIYFSGRPTTA